MKVTLPTARLVDAVGHAASVAASKSPKPSLECVALTADPSTGLSLEATDLDVGVRIRLPEADVAEGGTVLVAAGRLASVLREVQDEETTLTGDEGGLSLRTGRSQFRLRGDDREGFPEIPTFPEEGRLTVPGETLRNMIRRTAFATAKEAGRYALHGVLFLAQGGQLELVATDGRRLARAVRPLDASSDATLRVIVGAKGLSVLDRVMGTPAGDVAIALGERQVLFQVGGTLLVSRLIDGSFPAYEDVIPRTSTGMLRIGAADLAGALRKVQLLTTRDAISVQFEIAPETLTIRSRAAEVGEARVEVPIFYEGDRLQLGFNPLFLSDALKVMDPAAEVRFEFSDGKAPGKLTDDDAYVYVVMPIALE